MIEYLIKSAFCLALLLAVYHLLLENEKMHRFNRFYLLVSLGFGLLIPLISLGLPASPLQFSELQTFPGDIDRNFPLPANQMAGANVKDNPGQNYLLLAISIYGLGVGLLLMRFVSNLVLIGNRISRNMRIKAAQGTIVLVNENVIPHSFLGYTFLTKQDYLNGQVQEDIVKHEFTHVNQRHSLDLLLVELLKVIFWFNPVFIFYKKAIQLNHEFLADEAVITNNNNLSNYQQLLLQSVGLKTGNMASYLNYSITKKRLKMMTKHTSKTRKMIMGLSLIPVAAAMVFMFSDQVFAQDNSAPTQVTVGLARQNNISKEEYYEGSIIRFVDENGEDVKDQQKYESLSSADKKKLPSPVSPTNELIHQWKNRKLYKVSINYDAPLANLDNLKPDDFISYETYKSSKDKATHITLLKRDFLQEIKKLKGTFNWVNYGVTYLAPPPPVILPAKN